MLGGVWFRWIVWICKVLRWGWIGGAGWDGGTLRGMRIAECGMRNWGGGGRMRGGDGWCAWGTVRGLRGWFGGEADQDAGLSVVDEAFLDAVQSAFVLGAVAPDLVELFVGVGGDGLAVGTHTGAGRSVQFPQAAEQFADLGDNGVRQLGAWVVLLPDGVAEGGGLGVVGFEQEPALADDLLGEEGLGGVAGVETFELGVAEAGVADSLATGDGGRRGGEAVGDGAGGVWVGRSLGLWAWVRWLVMVGVPFLTVGGGRAVAVASPAGGARVACCRVRGHVDPPSNAGFGMRHGPVPSAFCWGGCGTCAPFAP